MKLCETTKNIYAKYSDFLQIYLSPILLLAIRVFIGLVFLKSGLVKFSNVDSSILLFEYEYQVPHISPIFATYSAMIFEILCGGALILGLLSRLAALPLIIMTLVIQFAVFANPEHFYWLFLLATIAIYGGGKLSLDGILCKFCKK